MPPVSHAGFLHSPTPLACNHRGECMLPWCDRALELPGPGEGQQRLCAAHASGAKQQEGPARHPNARSSDVACQDGYRVPTADGSGRADAAAAAARGREKTETGRHPTTPAKREITMPGSGSPGSKGSRHPGGSSRLERITESPVQPWGITALDFHRHRLVPPRSPEALANGGTSAPASSPTSAAAWRASSAGGRGGSNPRGIGLGREPLSAHAAAPPPRPPRGYHALRFAGGSGDPPPAAFGAEVSRSSATGGEGGGVVVDGPDRTASAIPMEAKEEDRESGRRNLGPVFPTYTAAGTSSAHLRYVS